jgi:hypothetical protein
MEELKKLLSISAEELKSLLEHTDTESLLKLAKERKVDISLRVNEDGRIEVAVSKEEDHFYVTGSMIKDGDYFAFETKKFKI